VRIFSFDDYFSFKTLLFAFLPFCPPAFLVLLGFSSTYENDTHYSDHPNPVKYELIGY